MTHFDVENRRADHSIAPLDVAPGGRQFDRGVVLGRRGRAVLHPSINAPPSILIYKLEVISQFQPRNIGHPMCSPWVKWLGGYCHDTCVPDNVLPFLRSMPRHTHIKLPEHLDAFG